MTLEALLQRGFDAFARGDFATASDAARQVMRIAPGNAGAMMLIGRLALVSARTDIALSVFQSLCASPEATAECFIDLARTMVSLRREEEALTAVRRAAELDPGAPKTFLFLGELLMSHDLRDEAAVALRRALELDPLETGAYQVLPRAVDIAPDSDEARRMMALLDDPRIEPLQRAELHFGLSRLYKRANDSEAFIKHMYAANAAQQRGAPGKRRFYENLFDLEERAFTAEALAKAACAPPANPVPIFIVGMPRSGTTLVEQIVAGHPDVAMGGELLYVGNVMSQSAGRLLGARFPDGFERLSAAQLQTLQQPAIQYFSLLARGKRYLTDKTPSNYHALPALPCFFPGCKIIHIERDPMDVCFSILQQPFDERAPHLNDVALLAYYYARYQRLVRQVGPLLGADLLTVRYEDLVRAPEAVGRCMLVHCGLTWDPAFLDFHTRVGAVHTFSAQQVRRGVNADAIGAWRAYEAELAPVRQALVAAGVLSD